MRCIENRDPDLLYQKGYRRTYSVEDAAGQHRLAHCHLFDYVEKGATLTDVENNRYSLRPNRKLMPTRWNLLDSEEYLLFAIQRINSINPLGRTLFELEDRIAQRCYRLTNLTRQPLDLVLGPLSTDWYLLEGDRPVAAIEKRKGDRPVEGRRGLLAKLKRWLQNAEWVLVEADGESCLSPPAYLALILLFDAHLERQQGALSI